jgi:hypothetical protein
MNYWCRTPREVDGRIYLLDEQKKLLNGKCKLPLLVMSQPLSTSSQVLTMPASNQPVLVPQPPPEVQDERMKPFYKRKSFKYVLLALVAALLAYYYYFGKTPTSVADAIESISPIPQAGGQRITVPALEDTFDVGGDYDLDL